MTPADLSRLSTLLDEALDLPLSERELWLAALEGEAAALAPTLRDLLARGASKETGDLLERGPTFTAPGGPETASTFQSGDAVGPYRLQRMIGQGGMGEVWLAERSDGQLKRQVALKLPVLGLRRSVLVQRFARERDIVGALAHPHIARLYDAGLADDGQPYLALEYVEGQPINTYCDARQLDLRCRVQLLLQVMDAVQYAHANLVIHRDLKPSNVLVTAEGQAMLLDFGIAKLLAADEASAESTELTQVGGRALTLEYAAPEQVGGAAVSTATDVYALGVLLYELLSGQRPFGGTRREMETAILGTEPPRPVALPADLATIVLKALKKAPAERFATVNAMAEDLGRWLRGEPVLAQPDSFAYRLRKFVMRRRVPVAAGSVAALALLVSSGAALHQADEARKQAAVAREQTRAAQLEARTAVTVQNFLEGIFRANSSDQADPVTARQRTAKELLDEGAARVEKELEDAPQARLRLLKTMATMYSDMAQLDASARLHARRAALAERVEGPGSPVRLEALSDQANELAIADRLDEAARVLERAASAGTVGQVPLEARLAYLRARARLASRTAPSEAVAPAQEAVALLRRQPPSKELVAALDLLGNTLKGAGRYSDAVPPLEESAALATRPDSLAPSTLFGTYIHLGDVRWRLGQRSEAEQAYAAALDAAKRYHGASSLALMIAQVSVAQFMERSDRLGEAYTLFQAALQYLRGQAPSSDKDSFVFSAYVSATGVYLRLGHLTEARALLDEAAAAGDRQRPSDGFAMRRHLRMADLHMETGSDEDAIAELNRARDLIEAGRGALRLAAGDEVSARVFLELRRRRPDAAAAAMTRWQALAGKLGTSAADDRLGAYLLCMVRGAQRDLVQAKPACQVALAELARARQTANNAVTEGRVRWALGRLLLERGQAGEAVTVLRDAVQLLDTVLEPDRSTYLIDPLAALAQASQASGNVRAAAAWRARALRVAAAQPRLSPHYVTLVREMVRAQASAPKLPG